MMSSSVKTGMAGSAGIGTTCGRPTPSARQRELVAKYTFSIPDSRITSAASSLSKYVSRSGFWLIIYSL